MEKDETLDPLNVGLLRSEAVVPYTNSIPNLLGKSRLVKHNGNSIMARRIRNSEDDPCKNSRQMEIQSVTARLPSYTPDMASCKAPFGGST